MQPNNYILQGVDPVAQIEAGMAAGLQRQAARQGMGLAVDQNARAEDANARAQELQPIAVEQAAANVDSTRLNQDATRQAIEAKQAAQQRKEAFRTAIGGLGPDATFEDYNAVSTQFPEFAAGINETWEGLSDGRKAGVANRLAQIGAAIKTGNLELAEKLAIEYADAAENSGDAASAATARAMADIVKTSPDAAMASLGLTLSTVDPDLAKTVLGTGEETIGSPKIFTNGLVLQPMSSGEPMVTTAGGERLRGQAAVDAVSEARRIEVEQESNIAGARVDARNQANIDSGGEAAAAITAGENAQKAGLDALNSGNAIRANIGNLQSAIDAIDNGAKSGTIESRVPTWNQSTLELRNLQSRLGLDVLGSVTLGAVSEKELEIALQVGLPLNLNETELRQWLTDKQDAQRKLMSYMDEQARFLLQPGNTLSDWLERVDSQAGNKGGGGKEAGFNPSEYGLKDGATQADLDRVQEIGRRVRLGEKLTPDEAAFIQRVSR